MELINNLLEKLTLFLLNFKIILWNYAHLRLQQKILQTDNKLLKQIKLTNVVNIQNTEQFVEKYQANDKKQIFKHIFLTEVITHMIINQFGKKKMKHLIYRFGRRKWECIDQDFEQLRAFGHRFSEFRDDPFKKKKKKNEILQMEKIEQKQKSKEDDNYQDDDEDSQQESENIQESEQQELPKGENRTNTHKLKSKQRISKEKGSQKKTKLKQINTKMQKIQGICNFTFISGKDKSKINKIRCCLYQMAKETQKTQALIDFLRMVFKVYPKQELVSTIKSKVKNKEKMASFMEKFKVKRNIKACFTEYTKESFFHKVLNMGLRVLKKPCQLAYLRLPFSNIFWSIKRIYQRHKRAIFEKREKYEKKTICLYRGFQLDEKEREWTKKNIGGYLQAEGFLSTTLNQSLSDAFIVNAKMIILISTANLRGKYDNGFAQISKYSEYSSQKEVLVNALNIFKIVSFQSQYHEIKEMIIHTICLEYGMKSVQEKVQKSENLLDAEYFWQCNTEELQHARFKLELNKEELSEEMYNKLVVVLPKAEEQLKKRKKYLKKWGEEEFEKCLKQLNEWEKEIIMNSQYQQQYSPYLESYGQLLYTVGDYRRASVYQQKRVKKDELGLALEGHHWRKSRYLTFSLTNNLQILYKCYFMMGRPASMLKYAQRLLNIYKCINVPESDAKYWSILYHMYNACYHVKDKQQKQRQRYKEQLMRILNKHKLFHTDIYKSLMMEEQLRRQKKAGEEENRKEEKKKMKQKLKHISVFSCGKYSSSYLHQQYILIQKLRRWGDWKKVIKEGVEYIHIRKQVPQVQNRMQTESVFLSSLEGCSKVRGKQEVFQFICEQLAHFIHASIHNFREFRLLTDCLRQCLKKHAYMVGKYVLLKLIKAKIQCKIEANYLRDTFFYGYGVLLYTASSQTTVDELLQWVNTVYQQQEYTKQRSFKKLMVVRKYNAEYSKSDKTVWEERGKDEKDGRMLEQISFVFNPQPNNQGIIWKLLRWESRVAQLMPFRRPFHPLQSNVRYVTWGIDEYFLTAQIPTLFTYFHLFITTTYGAMDGNRTRQYLTRVHTFSKLHLPDAHMVGLPSLLEFWGWQCPEVSAQMWRRGTELGRVIRRFEHTSDSRRQQLMRKLLQQQYTQMEHRTNTSRNAEVRKMNFILSRVSHHAANTSRRMKANHKHKIS